MCGIFGVIFRDPRARANEAAILAARHTLRHRGPDEAGLWLRPGAALAHQRLKVLDLAHGQQPMVCREGRRVLVYNGEVYNFRALRDDYRRRGCEFATDGDTEVVLEALGCDGTAAIDSFNGMFALGHWDERHRQLLLVRDRLGQKPLYWYGDDRRLVFASELKAVLEYLDRRFEIDPVALVGFDDLVAAAVPHRLGFLHLGLDECRPAENVFVYVIVDGMLAPRHAIGFAMLEGGYHSVSWEHGVFSFWHGAKPDATVQLPVKADVTAPAGTAKKSLERGLGETFLQKGFPQIGI